jgi:hypothetical protein
VSVACIRLNVIAIRCRLATISSPSSEESGAPHQPRFASYVNASGFRTPEIWQRGLQPSLVPGAFRSPPLLNLTRATRLTANASSGRTASDDAATNTNPVSLLALDRSPTNAYDHSLRKTHALTSGVWIARLKRPRPTRGQIRVRCTKRGSPRSRSAVRVSGLQGCSAPGRSGVLSTTPRAEGPTSMPGSPRTEKTALLARSASQR